MCVCVCVYGNVCGCVLLNVSSSTSLSQVLLHTNTPASLSFEALQALVKDDLIGAEEVGQRDGFNMSIHVTYKLCVCVGFRLRC